MIPAVNHIVVQVDLAQKERHSVEGVELFSGKRYNENFREKLPVVAQVIDGIGEIKTGMWLICSYTHFGEDSPFYLYDDFYAIPVNELVFAFIAEDGELTALCGNIFVERVMKESLIDLPEELKKPSFVKGFAASNGGGYRKGQEIIWLTMADHEIVYNWKGEEKRAVKVELAEIVGFRK